MRSAARFAGVAAASVAMLGMASPAFADSADNEGINVGNGNNASVVPVQACANNVGAAIGAAVPILSPQHAKCVNAPVVDHPMTQG